MTKADGYAPVYPISHRDVQIKAVVHPTPYPIPQKSSTFVPMPAYTLLAMSLDILRLLIRFILPAFALMALYACANDQAASASAPELTASDAQASHQRMVDTLAMIAQNADPQLLYSLNTARAAGIKQQIDQSQDPGQRTQLTYLYAQELLASGQIDLAIQTLQWATGQLPLGPNTKPFYDLSALAHLRKGEINNCLANHNQESCLLPIRGGGRHIDPSGSQQAIAEYQKILEAFPDDLQSRYLLNLAHQTLGSYPASVPAKWLIKGMDVPQAERPFLDIASLGHGNGDAHAGHQHHQMEGSIAVNELSGGVALGDFNGDGITDVFATSYGLQHPARLFLGDGKGGFRQNLSNLEGITGGLNCQAADFDNDGDLDVLVLRGGWFGAGGAHPNSLLQNDGQGRFTDVTYAMGLAAPRPSQTAAWVDLDLDGDLDLFIGNEANNQNRYTTEIYLNEGAAGFRESSKSCGIELVGVVKGVAAGDVNGDGWPDLYASCLGQPNRLFMHQGLKDGKPLFIDAAVEAGVSEPLFSFPTWMFDYDQDGDLDIFVSGYDVQRQTDAAGVEAAVLLGLPSEAEQMKLFQNDGKGKFSDVTEKMGLARATWSMGSNFGDIDADGWPDIYLGTGAPDLRSVVPNLLYRNKQGKGFSEQGKTLGLAHIQKGHGVGFADFDSDGDLDIYTVLGGAFEGDNFPNALFQNNHPQGKALHVKLEGSQANRSAIGAQVCVQIQTSQGLVRRYTTVGSGSSFGGNDFTAFIGLGDAERVDSLIVRWPDAANSIQRFGALEGSKKYRLVQGESPKPMP